MCVLIGDAPAPAALREVSASGAFLETNARPPLGSATIGRTERRPRVMQAALDVGVEAAMKDLAGCLVS